MINQISAAEITEFAGPCSVEDFFANSGSIAGKSLFIPFRQFVLTMKTTGDE